MFHHAAPPNPPSITRATDGIVCRYADVYPQRQIVLYFDGRIRFISPDEEPRDATDTADIFRHTASFVTYKIVMEGRTDVFHVSLRTLTGTQVLEKPEGNKTFHLHCEK
jgi:hypothetical protein